MSNPENTPIDKVPAPARGIAIRLLGVAIALPLAWVVLSQVESDIAKLVAAALIAILAVYLAVTLGAQRPSKGQTPREDEL